MTARYCNTLRGHVPAPCPRLPCDSCVDLLAERAAILQFGALKPGTTDPLCATREEADAMARAQALAEMPGQRALT